MIAEKNKLFDKPNVSSDNTDGSQKTEALDCNTAMGDTKSDVTVEQRDLKQKKSSNNKKQSRKQRKNQKK